MKEVKLIKKLNKNIIDEIQKMGKGLPTTFQKIDKLPYKFTMPDFVENFDNNSIFAMFINLVKINDFYYPSEIFTEEVLTEQTFEEETLYKLKLKKKYYNYANTSDFSMSTKNCNKKLNSKAGITFEDFEEKLKVIVMVPQMMFTLPNGETFQYIKNKNK